MLKSTYKPAPSSAAGPSPLPVGWTEHVAPTGHAYYYNEKTKESTYQRPQLQVQQLPPSNQPQIPSLADPRVANAYLAQIRGANDPADRGGAGNQNGRRGPHDGRPKPQPTDKPRRSEKILGHEPWILVYTKYSRRFVFNPEKNMSYWRIPEKLMPGILELDKARIRAKADEDDGQTAEKEVGRDEKKEKEPATSAEAPKEHDYDSSEYEEVEVTDDEGDEDAEDSNEPSNKRQRTEGTGDEGPVEFTEADIALQLQAMGEDYGLDPGEYDDGDPDNWPEGAEGVEFSEEDAKFLFRDLLEDLNINPYSPWDKLMEDGIIVEDPRYTALTTTRARKECWDEWTREKIAEIKEQRAKQEKKDPRIAYLAFLQEKASPKLYWVEFKRKHKKEDVMKDLHLPDKEKEKLYRDHIARLKLSQQTLKSDLTALLKKQPTHLLNNSTTLQTLPSQILTDIRHISLDPQVRDPLIEAFTQTLPPPPEDPNAAAQEDEETRKAQDARKRREHALEVRNRIVEEQRAERDKAVRMGKARLREEERELENALRIGKSGLRGQLEGMKVIEEEEKSESHAAEKTRAEGDGNDTDTAMER